MTEAAPAAAPTPTPGTGPSPASTPVVGMSDLIGTTPAQAKAELESMKNDPVLGKLVCTRVGYGEIASPEVLAAKSRWDTLQRIAFSVPSEVKTALDAANQEVARGQEQFEKRIAWYAEYGGLSAEEIAEFRAQRPIEPAAHDEAVRVVNAQNRDPEFGRRILAGDMVARHRRVCAQLQAAMPVIRR
jgi:hypothetical protein